MQQQSHWISDHFNFHVKNKVRKVDLKQIEGVYMEASWPALKWPVYHKGFLSISEILANQTSLVDCAARLHVNTLLQVKKAFMLTKGQKIYVFDPKYSNVFSSNQRKSGCLNCEAIVFISFQHQSKKQQFYQFYLPGTN